MSNLDLFLSKICLSNHNEKKTEISLCLVKAKNEKECESLKRVLSKQEQYLFRKIKYNHRKVSFLLGRYAAKMAVKSFLEKEDLTNIVINYGIFSYPILQTKVFFNCDLSISHCGNTGVGVVFEKNILLGIDIQEIRDLFLVDNNIFLTENEKKLINRAQHPMILATIVWTAKEALGKAIKTGLNVSLSVLEVKSVNIHECESICTFSCFSQYKAISVIANHYIFTVVIPSELDMHTDLSLIRNYLEEK